VNRGSENISSGAKAWHGSISEKYGAISISISAWRLVKNSALERDMNTFSPDGVDDARVCGMFYIQSRRVGVP